MKIGMIFPGQGSQSLGMGKEFYDSQRSVQELFEQASTCLDKNFVRLCFASSDKELCQTSNAQTAIFLVCASIFDILKKEYEVIPSLVSGHSSGEYAAIYAAGGLNFADALYLLNKRALFMEEATAGGNGGMLAVLGLSEDKVKEICGKFDDPSDIKKVAEVVNFNSSDQMVVSGTLAELSLVKAEVEASGGKAIMLNVAGAFHSRLMREAEANFDSYMLKVDVKDLSVPLINNIQAKMVMDHQDVKNSLLGQISSPVLWWQSMQRFNEMDLILEISPAPRLSKILKKEWPEKNIFCVSKPEDFVNLLTILGKKLKIEEIELKAEALPAQGEIKSEL